MLPLPIILQYKYPHADFYKDILLADHGDGIVIDHWGMEDPLPTKSDLEQWSTEFEAAYIAREKRARFEFVNKDLLAQLECVDKRTIRALRENDQPKLDELNIEADGLRQQLIPMEE